MAMYTKTRFQKEVKGEVMMIDFADETEHKEEEKQLWETRSIYKVPKYMRLGNDEAYTPQVISFGPYHYGEEYLKPMEEHKQRALRHFLRGAKIDKYIDALRKVEVTLVKAYDQSQESTEGFLELLVRDGCFMLEFLQNKTHDYQPGDPVFSKHGRAAIAPFIQRDMLLIENQIPLAVLEELALLSGLVNNKQTATFVVSEQIFNFFGVQGRRVVGGCHVLDVYRRCITDHDDFTSPTEDTKQHLYNLARRLPGWRVDMPWVRKKSEAEPPQNVPTPTRSLEDILQEHGKIRWSAAKLSRADICFKKSNTGSLTDIQFKDNTVSLPAISIDHNSESKFLNLVAFERLRLIDGHQISGYIYFMDGLIKSREDVKYLEKQEILKNDVGNDEDVDRLFNKLSEGLSHNQDVALSRVQGKISRHYEDYQKTKLKRVGLKWWRILKVNYFGSPWSFISVLAAIILLGLTVTQTVYAILSYQRN